MNRSTKNGKSSRTTTSPAPSAAEDAYAGTHQFTLDELAERVVRRLGLEGGRTVGLNPAHEAPYGGLAQAAAPADTKPPLFGQAEHAQHRFNKLLEARDHLTKCRDNLREAPPFNDEQMVRAGHLINAFLDYSAALTFLYDATS